jgi:hypothetical protein
LIIESHVSVLPPAEFLADYLAGRFAGRWFAFLEWLHDDMASRGIHLSRNELQASARRVVFRKPREEPVSHGYDFDSGYSHLLPLPELKIVTDGLFERDPPTRLSAEVLEVLRRTKGDARW